MKTTLVIATVFILATAPAIGQPEPEPQGTPSFYRVKLESHGSLHSEHISPLKTLSPPQRAAGREQVTVTTRGHLDRGVTETEPIGIFKTGCSAALFPRATATGLTIPGVQWPEYQKIIGGYFDQHPWHQAVVVEVAERDDPLVAFLGETIAVTDEIYQIRDFDVSGSRVLLRLDPTSVDLTQPNVHRHPYGWPLAWTRSYGIGRVFYTALGHEEGVWRNPRFQKLMRNAALWVLRKPA